jgi:hypothetical protein
MVAELVRTGRAYLTARMALQEAADRRPSQEAAFLAALEGVPGDEGDAVVIDRFVLAPKEEHWTLPPGERLRVNILVTDPPTGGGA